ncbi:MAG: hypothetical protein EA399_15745 [Desulfovibrionales bacterium]|nr:MAG: hypothetical protein EA399_15745 [Desulfovibrionales bacterium]
MHFKAEVREENVETRLSLRGGVISCLLMGLVLVFGTGCGKKAWPEPQLDEDRFYWGQIQHQRQGACLDARALVHGAANKLGNVYLEWMEWDRPEDCPECPFEVTSRVLLADRSSELKRQNGVIRILLCEWDPDLSYRWRLVGMNVHRGLGAVESQVEYSP